MGEEPISVFTSNRPGYIPEEPMAFVVELELPAEVPALTVSYPPLSTEFRNRFPTFTKPMQTLRTIREFELKLLRNYWA
jgi:hypothetical protein